MLLDTFLEFAQTLLDRQKYVRFLLDCFKLYLKGKLSDSSFDELMQYAQYNIDRAIQLLKQAGELLFDSRRSIVYPLEIKPVPAYPFSKVPIVRWSEIQNLELTSHKLCKLRHVCGKLGDLINTLFVLDKFVVIDIDKKIPELREFADVETRRGFHIIRYVKDAKFDSIKLKIKIETKDDYLKFEGTTLKIHFNEVHVDIKSGIGNIVIYPLQSRYLAIENNKLKIKKYRFVKKEAEYAFKSADLELLTCTKDDLLRLIADVISTILDIAEIKYERIIVYVEDYKTELNASGNVNSKSDWGKPKKRSWYNEHPILRIAFFTLDEIYLAVERCKELLPRCVVAALTERFPRGTRFAMGTLARTVLPQLCALTFEDLEKFLQDWCARNADKRSDVYRAKYYWHYFTGRMRTTDGQEVIVASNIGERFAPWNVVESLGLCKDCVLRNYCMGLGHHERVQKIVEYTAIIIERCLTEENS